MKRVTFEQAKKLKELEFPQEKNPAWFEQDGQRGGLLRTKINKRFVDAPTLHEVCDWLREEHKLYVVPSPLYIEEAKDSTKVVCDAWCAILMDLEEQYTSEQLDIDPYEFILFHEAQSAGIDKALDILEQKRNKK